MKWLPILFELTWILCVCGTVIRVEKSPFKLPVSAKFKEGDLTNLITIERQRAHELTRSFFKRDSSLPAINEAVGAAASIGIGCPPAQYTLMLNSYSPHTTVDTYNPTSCSRQIVPPPGTVGNAYSDTVTLSSSLVASNQSILVPGDSGSGLFGMLGLGPGAGNIVTDLFNQGTIPANQVAYSFEPTNQSSAVNGELTFGGTDSSKYTGNIQFAPVDSALFSEGLWGFNQTITYGEGTTILSSTTVVDTGTSLIVLATDAFQRYQNATGAVIDSGNSFLKITSAQLSKLQSLFFTIGNTTFEFTANAQLFPRALNSYLGGTPDDIFLIVMDLGSASGESGFDFINGFVWMERFYTVLDVGNSRVGFATTPFTNATVN